MMKRRAFLIGLAAAARPALAAPNHAAQKLLKAAENQIGRTVIYDPAYVVLRYPGGDVGLERGVCTDVVIRAYRDGLGIDLQKLVHEDMAAHFGSYPKAWGLTHTDSNIDHRRVPNLQTFFTRRDAQRPVPAEPSGWAAGDLVTMQLPGNLPHIGIVSDRFNTAGSRPLIIHNIGDGAAFDDVLTAFHITGRYRFLPDL